MAMQPVTPQTILLIEDEEVLSTILKSKLEDAGYHVETARDGEAGLAKIRAARPDLVLLDVQLPKLNGMSVLKALHDEGITPDLPVIIISNSGQPIELDLLRKLGAQDYLIKLNFEPAEILEKIHRLFQAREAAAEGHSPPQPAESGRAHAARDAAVLIVEDDTFLSELLARDITKEHMGVDAVTNVADARKVLDQKRIDLICLDAMLPQTDGFAFLEELKKTPALKHIPVLILSNLGQKEEVERGLRLGAAGYYVKAMKSPREIVEQIKSLLGVS